MKRKKAIKTIIDNLKGKEAIISSTGLISRELFDLNDCFQNFYMVGSMGLASSLGLGVAMNKPKKKVIIIEGDASLLMNLGSLATVGHFKPKNLIHIILDNEAYGSCSEESSISKTSKLDEIAKVVGYCVIKKVKNKKELKMVLKESLKSKSGPVFILVKIKLGGRRDLPRPMKLYLITKRFKKFLNTIT